MQIRISVVDPARLVEPRPFDDAAPSEVWVDAAPGSRFGAVAPHLLAALGRDTEVRFLLEGDPVPDDAEFGAVPLVTGVLLTLEHLTGSSSSAPDPLPRQHRGSLVEVQVIGGLGAGQSVRLGRGRHLIGRGPACAVRVVDPGVSRAHAEILVSDTGVRLRDLRPTNGTLVDGQPVPRAGLTVEPASRIRIGSTTLTRRSTTTVPAPMTQGPGTLRIHRQPRFVSVPQHPTITFPTPPQRPEGHRLPLIASLTPLLLALVLARVMNSPAMLLFALMSPVMLIGQWLGDRRHGRVSFSRQRSAHTRDTASALAALTQALASEASRRHDEQPDLALVCDVACGRDVRLWERRPGDSDHLALRVGTATAPAQLTVAGPLPDSQDPSAPPHVPAVPAVLALDEIGVAGICGPRELALSLVGGLVAQLGTWHSPREVRLVILTSSPTPAADWGWAARLPHARPVSDSCAIAAVASLADAAALSRRVAELDKVVTLRAEAATPLTGGERSSNGPDVVVILDGAHDLRLQPGVATLLARGPAAGLRFLCLDTTAERLPVETTRRVELHAAPTPVALIRDAAGVIGPVVPDLPSMGWLERMGRALAPLEDATPDEHGSDLPSRVSFVELHRDNPTGHVDPTDADDLARVWSCSPGAPRALIGAGRGGPYAVELATDGPHTLVGGTTGSGKSELLQTLVCGLAVTNRPDQLTFVLVDYKGGSAFQDCAHLPHTLGVVTDLDEHLTARALTSLGAELKRRERVLAAAGATDLTDYQERRGPGSAVLPRLVLVVDEFKMLADELPDFVAGLVRIAAVGRSLGVHLVLATQRPGGIVSGDMRANVALRIALRVRDRADSEDVIAAPHAAAVSDRLPGRGWIRTAGQQLHEIQTAHVGGPVAADQELAPSPAAWCLAWADLAGPAPRRDSVAKTRGQRTERAAVVDAARAAAADLGLDRLPSPWLPPLPQLLTAGELHHRRQATSQPGRGDQGSRLSVAVGLVDLPQHQRQDAWCWEPDTGHLAVAGGSRTGRSTLLRTIALTLADRYPPDQVHLQILEGTSGSLHDLARLPHVGSITGAADPGRVRRAISRLLHQLTAAPAPSTGRDGPATTVVLIDDWESLKECLEGVEHGQPLDDLMRVLRDGLASGLHVVITGGRQVLVGALPGLVQHRLALAMSDPLDLLVAGVPHTAVPVDQPPGRAVDVRTGAEVHLAVHVRHEHESAGDTQLEGPGDVGSRGDQCAATAAVARKASERWGRHGPGRAWQVTELPTHVALTAIADPGLPLLTIGRGGDDAAPVGFDLDRDHRRVLVGGTAGSGRSSTLLSLALRLVAGGRTLAVVTTRRSPLTQLSGTPTVHSVRIEDREALIALRRDHPDLAVLVDDAEGVAGTPLEQPLIELARLVESGGGFIAISIDLRRSAEHYRGLVPSVAAPGTGVLLSPGSVADGELFRVRVERQATRLPGRGLLIRDGQAVPVQIGDPTTIREGL